MEKELAELRRIVSSVATNQQVMSNNIGRLESSIEKVVTNSPDIAVMKRDIQEVQLDVRGIIESKNKILYPIIIAIVITILTTNLNLKG